ncbi:MAG: hypothetical protein JW798_12425 [Prolixibacteraceae bacterium]|nr:hypothetical protein [Prolixibacteraceae bacterium]
MKKFLKILVIIVVVLALIVAGAWYYLMHMPEKNLANQTPDYIIAATDLALEYEGAPEVSDKKYIDRVVEVTGIVAEISKDQNDQTVIILQSPESFTGILCTLAEKEEKAARDIAAGDNITLKGICTGMLFEVVLNRCVIVK